MEPPLWTALPFAAYLLLIALGPLFLGHLWEKNMHKLALGAAAGLPVAIFLIWIQPEGGHWLLHSLKEYGAFIALLGALYIITGGIHLKGPAHASPSSNTVWLAAGAVLASLVGTTGASMLLIRPLLRANEGRKSRVHIVVFFIFIVSNGGGLLTPLGDPPLFLGFLRGVPFLWTLRLVPIWLCLNTILLSLFYILDRRSAGLKRRSASKKPGVLEIEGAMNFLWLFAVVLVNLVVGSQGQARGWGDGFQKLLLVLGMTAAAGLSLALTPSAVRRENRFSWGPLEEVACIFAGVFVTMTPVLRLLEARGGETGVSSPASFFWASGLLSSFLDNAPTYLTFTSLAAGLVKAADPAGGVSADALGSLAAHPLGAPLLTAISAGAVLMGANSYIGNGPNFMVKAIAEESKVKMPGFFGYMAWSCGILLPIFGLLTLVFFR